MQPFSPGNCFLFFQMIPAALFVFSLLSNAATKTWGINPVICSESGTAEWAVLGMRSCRCRVLSEFVHCQNSLLCLQHLAERGMCHSKGLEVENELQEWWRSTATALPSLQGSAKGSWVQHLG